MNIFKLLSRDNIFFSGGVFVIMVNNIGPKELHRRILRLKPACVVAAPCDQVNSNLLDVVDQVRNKHNYTFLPPSRVPLQHFLVGRVLSCCDKLRRECSLSQILMVIAYFALAYV